MCANYLHCNYCSAFNNHDIQMKIKMYTSGFHMHKTVSSKLNHIITHHIGCPLRKKDVYEYCTNFNINRSTWNGFDMSEVHTILLL
jgi:hypothetical protein